MITHTRDRTTLYSVETLYATALRLFAPQLVEDGRIDGVSADASTERFASANDAQKAFALLVEDRAGTLFHGYTAVSWDEQGAQVNRYFVWWAERWVVKAHSLISVSDDRPS